MDAHSDRVCSLRARDACAWSRLGDGKGRENEWWNKEIMEMIQKKKAYGILSQNRLEDMKENYRITHYT